jgi:hypothetical protein
VVIDAREAQILERRAAQHGEDVVGGGGGIDRALVHPVEQLAELGNRHKWSVFVDFTGTRP